MISKELRYAILGFAGFTFAAAATPAMAEMQDRPGYTADITIDVLTDINPNWVERLIVNPTCPPKDYSHTAIKISSEKLKTDGGGEYVKTRIQTDCTRK